MANQLKMVDIQCILTLHGRGWSRRRIARELGLDRETVARYLRLSAQGGSPPAVAGCGVDSKPANALAGNDAAAATIPGTAADPQGGAATPTPTPCPAGKDEAEAQSIQNPPKALAGSPSRCEPWRQVVQEKLEEELSAQRIYQDLVAGHGDRGSYYSVCRLVRKLSASRELPYRRMECEAGAEAQVDFGRGVPVISSDGRSGSWVFRVILSHSRKGYNA